MFLAELQASFCLLPSISNYSSDTFYRDNYGNLYSIMLSYSFFYGFVLFMSLLDSFIS